MSKKQLIELWIEEAKSCRQLAEKSSASQALLASADTYELCAKQLGKMRDKE